MGLTAPNRTWAEINLDNIVHNYKEFCRITNLGNKSTRVMCVIKANGYGHGSVLLAKRLEKDGCNAFGVATLDEGLELRRAGISSFILLLNHIAEDRINEALENNLTMTVFSKSMAKAISDLTKKPTQIHIKTDTGMTRVGLNPNEALEAVQYIYSLPNIEIEGIFTHFSSADETDRAYTNMQIDRFNRIFSEIKNAGINIPIKHAANSAASIMYPEAYFDMVRVGISLYGCYPSEEVDKSRIDLKPCMQLKTQIIRLNDVEPGVAVSYGRLFTTERKSKLATIPVGYADGISRVLATKLAVLVNGQVAPVVGKICMDQCVVDVTDITGDINVSDEVVIYGEQNGKFIPVEQVAAQMGTINYEILCLTSRRVLRYYTENGKITSMVNFLE
ncbi:MAG: alanine racemase [Defluviitaleaceae bacterium]|nr:alanine racemase [Defluviitaleaceae bacterium]